MKKVTSCFIILLCVLQSGFSQTVCYTDGVVFSNQSEIDQFAVDFPLCIQIGRLEITGSGITDLSPFESLRFFPGGLYIHNCPDLVELNFFSSAQLLQEVIIEHNGNLITIDDFHNVTSVSRTIDFWENNSLVSIDGFDALVNLAGDLRILRDTVLAEIIGFQNLQTIGGDLIWDELNMEDIYAFGQLQRVEGMLNITDFNLNDISGFNSLLEVGDRVEIEAMGSSNLSGFLSLYRIGGAIVINSSSVETILGFQSLTKVGGVIVGDTEELTNLDFLNSVKSLDGPTIRIQNNFELSDIKGLKHIIDSGLESVDFVIITENPKLSECQILPICDLLSGGQNLVIAINNNLPGCNSADEILDRCVTDTLSVAYHICDGDFIEIGDSIYFDFGYFELSTEDCFGLEDYLRITISERDIRLCDQCSSQPTLGLQIVHRGEGLYDLYSTERSYTRIASNLELWSMYNLISQHIGDFNRLRSQQNRIELGVDQFEQLVGGMAPLSSLKL